MRSSASLLLRLSPAIDALLTAVAFGAFWEAGQLDDRALAFLNLLVIPSLLGTLRFVGVYESQRMETRVGLVRKVMTANAIVFSLEAIGYLIAAGPDSLRSLWGAAAAVTL